MIDTTKNSYAADPTEQTATSPVVNDAAHSIEMSDQESNDVITSYERTEHSETNYAPSSGDLDKSQTGGQYDNTGTSEYLYETSPDEYYNQQDAEYTDYTDYTDTKYVDAADVKLEGENETKNNSKHKRKKQVKELPPYEISDRASLVLVVAFVVVLILIVCVGAVLGSQLSVLSKDSDDLEQSTQEVSEEYNNLSTLLSESGVLEIPYKV